MHFSQSFSVLFSFALLASGTVIPRATIDPDNPEASDPKTPPKKLNRPPRPDNPFKGGFKTAPASCKDFMKPSQQCVTDLKAQPGGIGAFSGGELKWDSDNKCDERQKGMFQTAAWDAHALAQFTDQEPNPHNYKDIAFCKDTKNYCPVKKDGKSVGGYAWTYDGWFGYKYYYITMCNPFFQSDDLMYKIDQIEEEMQREKFEKAQQAKWQKSTGQMFLHEMMHLNSVGTPHINDEHVDPDSADNWAYGPSRTHMLARRKLNQGGGAARASTNADSYAWLANSKYWWDLTGHFPRPDNYKQQDELSANAWVQEQNAFTLDFGTIRQDTPDSEITKRLNAITNGFKNGPPPSGSKPGVGSKPSAGKSLSILAMAQVNTHGTSGSTDYSWRFFTTNVGKAVDECAKNGVEEITPSGGTDPKLPSNTNMKKLSWPAGEFKLKIEGEDCEYKCDGKNPGRLYCQKKEVACKEDTMKNKDEGVKMCGTRMSIHAVVYCDF
ncbi:hypothetical protein CC86DRAFT_432123 [Ophiobolus disseminans]|uniref:Uncharacterized protein n=1 Tax=Ophiobolus disseminans TaxID=1469910 RepID=A0A6A6ZFN7_9PLEO|nr:hypothetical protein CC86DRAFT_432123 [Ophiobolus disseminans]